MSPLVINIRKWRKKCGFTQAELANKVGARQATISDFETGKTRRIELDLLDALARTLGCEPGDLLELRDGASHQPLPSRRLGSRRSGADRRTGQERRLE